MNEAETRAEHIDPALRAAGWGVVPGSRILREYPPDFFDFIIIDECHRGGANDEGNWRAILEYFASTEKTLVFCANQAHALLVRDLINQLKTNPDPNYCQRVTANDGELAEMQKIIDAEQSDLFDVLAHVAYAMPPQTRQVRAAAARVHINTRFPAKQKVFLDFVLQHYVNVGVEELAQEKLTPLLRLKYHDSIADAIADLGRPDEIGKCFAGFQKYLYQEAL